MITFIIGIVYILIGIFLNYKYNKQVISYTRKVFPILSNLIIPTLIILWPALVAAKIENWYDNRMYNKYYGKRE